jgi:electron transport complex protein RnfC
MMISAILGEEVPSGKLPIDVGALVTNVGTIAALSQYFRQGSPLSKGWSPLPNSRKTPG